MKGKPDRMMVVAGGTSIRDVAVGPDGQVHVVGYARGKLPKDRWLPQYQHRRPKLERKRKPETGRDPFVISLSADYTSITRCWSFPQAIRAL